MGGHIFLRSIAGLCDSMFMFEVLTKYAQRYNRTIIWDLALYNGSDLNSIFDFSSYPVKVLCGYNHINRIRFSRIEPPTVQKPVYTSQKHDGPNLISRDGQLPQFDMTKEYHDSVLLVYYGGESGYITMDNLRFNKNLVNEYHSKLNALPKIFDAVHLRATDHYDQNLEENLNSIRNFVKNKKNVYLASDNMLLMKSLSEEFSQIIKSSNYEQINKPYRSLHHEFGKTDHNSLKKAVIDILICSSSDNFLPSVGGFSRLIDTLHKNKELFKKLTSGVELLQLAE